MLPNWEQLKTQLMLPQLASSALETALLHLLKRTQNHQAHLRKLNGKVLSVELQQSAQKMPEARFYFLFSEQQIDVLHQYAGEVECAVQTSAKTLLKMPKKSELTQYINDKSIVIHGDLQVLQDFLALLDVVEKDPAELLAPYVGDVLAYNMTKLAKQGLAFFQAKQRTAQQHWGERLSEEWHLTVPRLAVADFQQQVGALSQQSDRLEQKFQQLLDKLGMNKS